MNNWIWFSKVVLYYPPLPYISAIAKSCMLLRLQNSFLNLFWLRLCGKIHYWPYNTPVINIICARFANVVVSARVILKGAVNDCVSIEMSHFIGAIWMHIYFCCKFNIWNVSCVLAGAFISDSWTDAVVKLLKFWRHNICRAEGTQTPKLWIHVYWAHILLSDNIRSTNAYLA